MKIPFARAGRSGNRRHGERGMAVIVVIIIISILLIYVGGNLRALHLMRQDLKLIEQKQISRLKTTQLVTNSIAAAGTTNLLLRPGGFRSP